MRVLLRAVTSSIGILVIVGIIISLGIWFVGPLVAIGEAKPFGTLIGRLIGLAVFWLITLIVILIMVVMDNRRESRIVNEVAAAQKLTANDCMSCLGTSLSDRPPPAKPRQSSIPSLSSH
jgi:type VI secretion system protein ImpL